MGNAHLFLGRLFSLRIASCPGAPPGFRPQTRRYHGIVVWQTPLASVFLRRHAEVDAQMALEQLYLLPVLEADQVVVVDRFLAPALAGGDHGGQASRRMPAGSRRLRIKSLEQPGCLLTPEGGRLAEIQKTLQCLFQHCGIGRGELEPLGIEKGTCEGQVTYRVKPSACS